MPFGRSVHPAQFEVGGLGEQNASEKRTRTAMSRQGSVA